MTREEATEKLIELRRYCVYEAESDENGSGIWCDDVNALDMVISALREQKSKDTNVPTNADHIHSMTDEELGKFCIALTDDGWPFACQNKPECEPVPKEPSDCNKCFMDWLKQPYKEKL